MNEPTNNLERLVSRYLDDECSVEERRQLRQLLRKDAEAEAFFEETAALDREIGRAMRHALGRPVVLRRQSPRWIQIGRAIALGAAACLAWVFLNPGGSATSQRPEQGRPMRASWFAPPPAPADTMSDTRGYDRPQVRLDNTESRWIVVPGERPGEFLVVEVKRVKTRTIPVQGDF
ncbi:MAG: hypothetical protein HZB38_04445 [Planctomycetes bacterium]|nr:hypothetical protein [Planctomycetota bacterium]